MFTRSLNPIFVATCAILLAGALYGFGYYRGYSNVKIKFDAFKLEIKVNAEALRVRNLVLASKQNTINNNVVKEHKNAISKLHTYYTKHPVLKWMPNNSTSSNGLSKVSNSTIVIDGEAEINQINTTGINPIDCATDVLQLLYLQKWIKEQLIIQ